MPAQFVRPDPTHPLLAPYSDSLCAGPNPSPALVAPPPSSPLPEPSAPPSAAVAAAVPTASLPIFWFTNPFYKAVKKLVKHFESDSPDFDAADHAALNSGQTDPQYSYTMGTQVDQLVDNTLFPPAPTLFPTAEAKPTPEPTPIPTRRPTLAPSRAPTFSWGR